MPTVCLAIHNCKPPMLGIRLAVEGLMLIARASSDMQNLHEIHELFINNAGRQSSLSEVSA